MKPRTAQDENYLKVIWGAEEWSRPATVGSIAAALSLAPSSVSEAVRKLAESGLVQHAPYGAVALTDAGRSVAVAVVRKHRLIETFLVEELGYAWDEVHEEAEVLEHAVSERFIDAIEDRLGHPELDPHGDPIPRRDGTLPGSGAVTIDRAPADAEVRIVRVSDAVPGLLKRLGDRGLGLGSVVVAGSVQLAPEEAAGVLVEAT